LLGKEWVEPVKVHSVHPGDIVSGELARRALHELDRTGRYAELSAHLSSEGGQVVLTIEARPRRIVQQIRSLGGDLPAADEERALGVPVGDAVTEQGLLQAQTRMLSLYESAGYPQAEIAVRPVEVDDPRNTLIRIDIKPGPVLRISQLRF